MKKVLFTTTALVASAGFAGMAAAQVSLSGSAEMGIIGGDIVDPGADPQFHTDIDVTFTMSGATDNGLTFGASIDLDESTGGGAFGNTTQGGESMFLSGSFGTINAGDVDGAFDARLTEVASGPGSLNDDHTAHSGYSGNGGLDGLFDGQIVRYDYTFGGFTASASAEIDDADAAGADDVFGIGGSYQASSGGINWGVGFGYQTGNMAGGGDRDVWGVSGNASFANGFQATINYSDLDGNTPGSADEHFGIGGSYSVGAISVGANYGVFDLVGGGENEGYGFAAGYDLGGGAEVLFGYGNSDPQMGPDMDRYSFGVSLSF